MGHLKDIVNQPKLQTFPNAKFEIAGDVPASQCSEAKIEGDDARTFTGPPPRLQDVGAFTGWALAGKKCTIVSNAGAHPGTYNIVWNTNDVIELDADPGIAVFVTYYIHNGGELILTRDVQSFAEFIHAAGYAYTIKGGKLYTTIPFIELKNACTILFDPLT